MSVLNGFALWYSNIARGNPRTKWRFAEKIASIIGGMSQPCLMTATWKFLEVAFLKSTLKVFWELAAICTMVQHGSPSQTPRHVWWEQEQPALVKWAVQSYEWQHFIASIVHHLWPTFMFHQQTFLSDWYRQGNQKCIWWFDIMWMIQIGCWSNRMGLISFSNRTLVAGEQPNL